MIRLWLCALARKSASGRQIKTPSRAARRPNVRLRLEPLEDRTVTSVVSVEPPFLPQPPDPKVAIVGPDGDFASPDGVDLISGDLPLLVGPGILPDPAGVLPVSPFPEDVTDLDFPTSAGPAPDIIVGSAATQLTSSPTLDVSTFAAPPPGGNSAPSPDQAEPKGGQSSSPAETAQSRPVTAAPGEKTDPGQSATAEGAPLSPAPPAALAGEQGDRAAPSALAANILTAAVSNRPVVQQTDQSATAGTPAARSSQEQPDRHKPETKSIVPQPFPAGRDEAPEPGVEAKRSSAELPDGTLLQRFALNQEQAAFAVLVRRHERLVMSTCQRVLGDAHAARDAFQATFLVLARKAGVLDRNGPLSGWLCKVAYHLSLRLRAVVARQRRDEGYVAGSRPTLSAGEPSAAVEQKELHQALREELQRLPERYRLPLVLCFFDGHTHDEAARAIGLPRGSMAKRIGEGLERLRERLLRRGFLM